MCDGLHPSQGYDVRSRMNVVHIAERAQSPHEGPLLFCDGFSAMGYTHRRGYCAPSGLAEHQALKGRHLLTKGVALREHQTLGRNFNNRSPSTRAEQKLVIITFVII
jgi:hypothetical protein